MRATPLPAATYLAAVLVSTLVVFLLQMVVTVALGVRSTARAARRAGLALVPCSSSARRFAGLGIGLAALIRSAEGASAVVNLVVLPMAFLSGSFGPTRDYPDVLQAVADVLPLTYLIRLVQAAYLHGASLVHDLGAVARRRRVGRRRAGRGASSLRVAAARALTPSGVEAGKPAVRYGDPGRAWEPAYTSA